MYSTSAFFQIRTMSPCRKGSGASKKGTKVSLSGSRIPRHAGLIPSAPERPEAAAQDEPLPLSGFVASPDITAPSYVTEDSLATALEGLQTGISRISFVPFFKVRHLQRSVKRRPFFLALNRLLSQRVILEFSSEEQGSKTKWRC